MDTRYSDRFLLHPLSNPNNYDDAQTTDVITDAKEKSIRHPFFSDRQQQQPHQKKDQTKIQHEIESNEKPKLPEQNHKQRTQQRQQHNQQNDFDMDSLLQQLNWN